MTKARLMPSICLTTKLATSASTNEIMSSFLSAMPTFTSTSTNI
jgi:hypothetical protein